MSGFCKVSRKKKVRKIIFGLDVNKNCVRKSNKKKGELSFGGRWTPKLTKGPYNSSNWVEGYEIVTDKYTL